MVQQVFEGGVPGRAGGRQAGRGSRWAGASSGGRVVPGTYAGRDGVRPYQLFVPSGYRDQALPLVVMLHGCLQSPAELAASTRMNALAEAHTFLVAYPEQTTRANRSRCWNWYRRADQARDAGEPALIAGITRQVMRLVQVDPRRVYIAGISAGGAMAAIMAATYPDLYAAVGIHSGVPYGAAENLFAGLAAMRRGRLGRAVPRLGPGPGDRAGRHVPLILFHGDRDRTVHPANAEELVRQWRAAAGLASAAPDAVLTQGQAPGGRPYRRTIYCDSRGEPFIEEWIVHGTGHAWSGGSPDAAFTDPRGPDASAEMLRFFLQQP